MSDEDRRTTTMGTLDQIFGLQDKVAVVTGAAHGFGRIFSYALAEAGAEVVVIDVNAEGLEETAAHIRSIGREAHPYTADVSVEEQVVDVFAQIQESIGRTDILVNNAGISDGYVGVFHEYPSEQWRRIIDVNLNGVFLCSREALKGMHARGKGKIINIASMWGFVGAGLISIPGYAATKGAVINLTRQMALEYAPQNIQINAICPGFHRTGFGGSDTPEFMDLMASTTPAGRVAEPSELQGTLIYLASSASDFMCGSAIVVDGGFLAR
jgi:NAD(P)-dependent dehydrogenase (short-subunit alcohol dehydrogenase family)